MREGEEEKKKERREKSFWLTRVGRLVNTLFGHRPRQRNTYLANLTTSDEDSGEAEVVAHGRRHRPEELQVLCRTTRFTCKELRFIYRGFKNECPNGMITEEVFKQIYSQFFPHGDCSAYAHFVFKTFDQDKRGTIMFEDFVMGLSLLVRGSVDERLRWTFSLYDVNNDGYVTKDDLHDIVTAVHSLVGVGGGRGQEVKQHSEVAFSKFDVNKDGAISIEDFLDVCKRDETIRSSVSAFDTLL